jgi:hypothetical protein
MHAGKDSKQTRERFADDANPSRSGMNRHKSGMNREAASGQERVFRPHYLEFDGPGNFKVSLIVLLRA